MRNKQELGTTRTSNGKELGSQKMFWWMMFTSNIVISDLIDL